MPASTSDHVMLKASRSYRYMYVIWTATWINSKACFNWKWNTGTKFTLEQLSTYVNWAIAFIGHKHWPRETHCDSCRKKFHSILNSIISRLYCSAQDIGISIHSKGLMLYFLLSSKSISILTSVDGASALICIPLPPAISCDSLILKFLCPSRTESSTMVTLAHWMSPMDCPEVKVSVDGSGPMKSTPSAYVCTNRSKN